MRCQFEPRILVLTCLAVGCVGFFPLQASDRVDSEHVNTLFADARSQASQLREDASMMESFTRLNVGWEHHTSAITQVREHVNAVGRTLKKLDDARDTASPWQATAIDRIRPLLQDMGANTTKIIDFLNANPKRLFQHEYVDYLESNADIAGRLSGLIADIVDYSKTKSRFERLGSRLELPTKE